MPTRNAEAKRYEQAAESYLAAVEVYRAVDGPFTPLAIAPLTEPRRQLSRRGGRRERRRRRIRKRAPSADAPYGLHNQEQVELLDCMSRFAARAQLSSREAEAQQVEALRLVQRSNAPDSDEVLDAIYKYAEWLGERLLFQLERDQFTRALRIIRESHGDKDVRQVRALLGIGNTYREERNPASAGISSLQEALALLLAQPQPDAVSIAGALRDIGDWSVAFGKTGYDGLGVPALVANARLRRPRASACGATGMPGANYVLYEPISPRGLSTEPNALSGHVTRQLRHRHRGQQHQRDARRIGARRAQRRSRAPAHSPLALSPLDRRRPTRNGAVTWLFRSSSATCRSRRRTAMIRATTIGTAIAALAACARCRSCSRRRSRPNLRRPSASRPPRR